IVPFGSAAAPCGVGTGSEPIDCGFCGTGVCAYPTTDVWTAGQIGATDPKGTSGMSDLSSSCCCSGKSCVTGSGAGRWHRVSSSHHLGRLAAENLWTERRGWNQTEGLPGLLKLPERLLKRLGLLQLLDLLRQELDPLLELGQLCGDLLQQL